MGGGEDDETTPDPVNEAQHRVVRLPVVPRDAAIGEGRPLSDTAREHGFAFHRWVQNQIEKSRNDGPDQPDHRRKAGFPGAIAAAIRRLLRRS